MFSKICVPLLVFLMEMASSVKALKYVNNTLLTNYVHLGSLFSPCLEFVEVIYFGGLLLLFPWSFSCYEVEAFSFSSLNSTVDTTFPCFLSCSCEVKNVQQTLNVKRNRWLYQVAYLAISVCRACSVKFLCKEFPKMIHAVCHFTVTCLKKQRFVVCICLW